MASDVLDAAYHITYYDNSGGWTPGPSDWDIRVALQMDPEDVPLWIEGFEAAPEGTIDLAHWDGLFTQAPSWEGLTGPAYYRRPAGGAYLISV